MEWDISNIKAIKKTISDYSGRKRINIVNDDGLVKGDAVIVMKQDDYDDLIADYIRLKKLEQEQDNSRVTADAIADKFIKPLQDSHKATVNDMKNQYEQTITDKDNEINRLKAVYQDYDKKVYSLGIIDILRHKNRDISDDFNSKIWLIKSPASEVITDANIKKLDGE